MNRNTFLKNNFNLRRNGQTIATPKWHVLKYTDGKSVWVPTHLTPFHNTHPSAQHASEMICLSPPKLQVPWMVPASKCPCDFTPPGLEESFCLPNAVFWSPGAYVWPQLLQCHSPLNYMKSIESRMSLIFAVLHIVKWVTSWSHFSAITVLFAGQLRRTYLFFHINRAWVQAEMAVTIRYNTQGWV